MVILFQVVQFAIGDELKAFDLIGVLPAESSLAPISHHIPILYGSSAEHIQMAGFYDCLQLVLGNYWECDRNSFAVIRGNEHAFLPVLNHISFGQLSRHDFRKRQSSVDFVNYFM